MVSDPSTGCICGFEVYTGDASGQSQYIVYSMYTCIGYYNEQE